MPIQPDPERLRELRKDHGVYAALTIARREARAAAIDRVRHDIDSLHPEDPDFIVTLRTLLRTIADLLEG